MRGPVDVIARRPGEIERCPPPKFVPTQEAPMNRTLAASARHRSQASTTPQVQPLEGRVLFAAADLDPTFSGDGKALVDFFGAPSTATAVAVQADGKVLLAGTIQG